MAAKLAKKKKEKENTGKIIMTSFLEYMSVLWAVVLVIALPVYIKDGYYQIGATKFEVYARVALVGLPILLALVLVYLFFSVREKGISVQGCKNVWADMSATDRFVVFYFMAVLVSYIACGNWKEAFWGYAGWYMGMFSQLTFVLIYFICSRFLKDSSLVLSVLCIVSTYVFVLGIQHRLLIDPIGVYESLTDYYKTQFLSTLGQASWYSSFMTIILPIGMFAFWHFKNLLLRIVSGLFVLCSFMTMVTQNTDSAYFGFLAATLVLLHVSIKDARSMRRLFEVMLLFTISPKVMQLLLNFYPNDIMTWDTISYFLVFDPRVWVLTVFCVIMIVVFALLDKKNNYPQKSMRIARNILYGVLLMLLFAWVVILALSAKGMLPTVLLSLTESIPYLIWDDTWGNGRGFTWSATAKMMSEMNIKDRLFGVGPDCYAIYAHGNYNELMKSKWGDMVLCNAHNEWLNTFFDLGLLGGITYLGIFVTAIGRFVKKSSGRPVLIGMAACIAAYMAHNMFCYQQVLCTPFVFLFLAIGEYQIRKKAE